VILQDSAAARTGESAYPERRGVSGRSVITKAKQEIPTIDLADRLVAENGGGWHKVGKEWVASCPLPDHLDRSPSFTVYAGDRGWFCFGCQRGGDVIELARYAWSYERSEAVMAAADLLREFGHEMPEEPATWAARQKRRAPAREALEEAKVRHVQRRVFRIFVPVIEAIEDEDERREETEHLWDAAEEIAALIWAGRRAS
jgi:hypothetical protein